MPDSNNARKSDDFSAPNLPSSEDLDRSIEEQEIKTRTTAAVSEPFVPEETVAKINSSLLNRKPGQCFRCENTPLTFCRHCGQEFCSEHKSRYNNGICCLCVASDNLGIEFVDHIEEELDDQGNTVQHRGRRIKLIGEGWPNTMQMIDSMDDEGLEIFIEERKRFLQDAIRTTEYHRITLSKAEFKKEYSRKSKMDKLRKRSEALKNQGSLRVGGKVLQIGQQPAAKKKNNDALIAASLGMSIEQYEKLKKLVGK